MKHTDRIKTKQIFSYSKMMMFEILGFLVLSDMMTGCYEASFSFVNFQMPGICQGGGGDA